MTEGLLQAKEERNTQFSGRESHSSILAEESEKRSETKANLNMMMKRFVTFKCIKDGSVDRAFSD